MINGSITQHLSGIRRGDRQAAEDLFRRLNADLQKLECFAERKLHGSKRRADNEEDVVQESLLAFCIGLTSGKFPRLRNRKDVYGILYTIIHARSKNQRRDERRQKRGGGNTKGESVFEGAAGQGLHEFAGPQEDVSLEIAEAIELLKNRELIEIALFLLAGHSFDETMEQFKFSEDKLKRKLAIIKKTWQEAAKSS